MPTPISNLLDTSLGIQNVMDMPAPSNLPRARELASNALNEPGLEELYAPGNAWQLVEQSLCPDVGDGSMLNPEVFSGTLETCVHDLEGRPEPAVQEMLSQELKPLLQNGQLLQAYLGLMIGG